MGIAVVIFFAAILAGFIFLGFLIWLVFLRRRPNSPNRNFRGGPGSTARESDQHREDDFTNYAAGSYLASNDWNSGASSQSEEMRVSQFAEDNPAPSESSHHDNEAAPPAGGSWSESPASGSDFGSGYDSGSGSSDYSSSSDSGTSDSGSSGSDSGSSSSSD